MKVRVVQRLMREGRRKGRRSPTPPKKSSTCVHLSSEDAQTCLSGCRCFCVCVWLHRDRQRSEKSVRQAERVERRAGRLRLSHEYVARQGGRGGRLFRIVSLSLATCAANWTRECERLSQDLFLRRRRRRRRKVMKEASGSEEQRGSNAVHNRKHHKQNYFSLIEAEDKSITVIEFSIIPSLFFF